MDKKRKQHRDRLVVLSFVSVLLVLAYGPASQWFLGADRFMFDQFATYVRNEPLPAASIISINPAKKSPDELAAEYGRILNILKLNDARRIILPQGPKIDGDAELPGWAVTLAEGSPVFVPSDHRLADFATKTGILDVNADSDGVLRQSRLWHLQGGIMSPSLPLSVALSGQEYVADSRLQSADSVIYLTNYSPIERIEAEDVLGKDFKASRVTGRTIFVDSEPPIVGATAILPSQQFVTHSEIVASLLANIEQRQIVNTPTWVRALEWVVPALLAIVAALFLVGRKRQDILLLITGVILGLMVLEALFLLVGRMRLDLGRPVFVFLGVGALGWWLAGDVKKAAVNAFKRGSDFLAAGRLEPAFAEFRRCEPTETLASVMYKLSLAFEEQSKPERAEAVLQWLKRTHSGTGTQSPFSLQASIGKSRRLGRYVIEKKIGKGAMGAVYLARDPRINRPVALKVIPLEKEFEDEDLEEARLRFFREAESAGRLTHPNIITVYDCGEDKHLAYIAMEYLQGISLTEFTDQKKLLAPNKALELCARVADALDYAHNQGVIHRDIKPANVLYSLRNDTLKISDFGVARLTDNNRTKTGIVLGTPMYMSPEQLNAEDLTGLSDLFSLGVTLYELLVGEVPFKASNIAVLMTKITSEDPAPVSNRRPGVPPAVDAVLFKALAKRPEKRFANGGEMAIALRNCAKYAS